MRLLAPVRPTPEQLKVVGDNRPGFVLIRGAAGSGKTTTALLRLKQLCAFWLSRRAREGLGEPVRVLVLTYNRTLEGYIAELARQQVEGNAGLQLQVVTFGKWAYDLIGGQPTILDRDGMVRLLRPTLRSFPREPDFLVDEIDYVLGRFRPANLDAYTGVKREGRGASPRMNTMLRSRLIDDVIEPYIEAKRARGVMDWNDIAIAAGDVTGVPPYDVVIVDEAQDFSANQVRTIIRHLGDAFSATFVMDAVQRIYPRYFTWAEAGVEFTGNPYTLRQNYRNTTEIAAFARPLVEGLPLEDDGALPDFDACSESGALPLVVAGKYSDQINYILKHLLKTVDFTTESVVFLQPRGGRWFDYLRSQLRGAGVAYTELTRASTWPTGPEAVALCTFHSAKGLEFDHVVMPGLNQEVTPHGPEEGDAQLDALRRLVAMGVGRARKSVVVGYKPDNPSSAIGLLKPDTYRLVRL